MEKLKLLESVLGQGHKTNRDYYQFMCPFCNHHKPKLGVSLGTGKWKCWVCGVNGGKVTILLRKINAPKTVIQLAEKSFKETEYKSYKKEENSTLTLPKEFLPLWKEGGGFYHKKALKYLQGRGLSTLDILKHRIGYCDHGKYKDMVIFPHYNDNGTLVYFSGRSYLPNPMFKFSTPTLVDKDLIYDEDLVNWSEPIIIVESKLDAIIVRRNAVPLNGKQISKSLISKILDEGVSRIYLCLDGDAIKDIMKYSMWFIEHGIDVYVTEFSIDEEESKKKGITVYHDPASLGHEKVWEYIEKARKVTEINAFKYNLIQKLNK